MHNNHGISETGVVPPHVGRVDEPRGLHKRYWDWILWIGWRWNGDR